MIVDEIEQTLQSMADAEKARGLMRFFKTGPGQYGEGDKFLGIKNPDVHLVVREAWKDCTLEDASQLAQSEWHEVRLTSLLIMVELFRMAKKKKDEPLMHNIFHQYTSLHPYINNWDLVDLSAPKIAGNYEILFPEEALLDEWIQPGHTLWQRRIAMVACWMHARERRYGQLLMRAEALLDAHDDLLHKASGWMLREMGKSSEEGRELLVEFLENHVSAMSATMLSYATEKLPVDERHYWQQRRKA